MRSRCRHHNDPHDMLEFDDTKYAAPDRPVIDLIRRIGGEWPRVRELRKIIRALPLGDQALLYSMQSAGGNMAAVARMMSMPEKTVRNHVYALREHLWPIIRPHVRFFYRRGSDAGMAD